MHTLGLCRAAQMVEALLHHHKEDANANAGVGPNTCLVGRRNTRSSVSDGEFRRADPQGKHVLQ